MRFSTILNIVLVIIIAIMAWLLFINPETVSGPTATTTGQTPTPTTTPSTTEPLSSRVTIMTPKSGATVGKTFEVSGMAPGNWYFEASFPVQVRDKDGNILVSVPAQAQSDWMTTEQVPYKVTLTIAGSYKGPAKLILLKDNPSGLPEHDDAVEIPIVIQ